MIASLLAGCAAGVTGASPLGSEGDDTVDDKADSFGQRACKPLEATDGVVPTAEFVVTASNGKFLVVTRGAGFEPADYRVFYGEKEAMLEYSVTDVVHYHGDISTVISFAIGEDDVVAQFGYGDGASPDTLLLGGEQLPLTRAESPLYVVSALSFRCL